MKVKKSRIVLIISISIVLLVIYNWSLLQYGIMQGKGQYKVLSQAKPLSHFINEPTTSDTLKVKIKQLQQIKTFAKEVFDLPAEDQYLTLYDQKGADVLWVITASEAYSIKDYSWKFPFLGEVSYKGFFNYERAVEAFEEMEKQGFDVRLRPVSAWSTLGWFNDPILSNVMYQSEAKLAELVFHELIHDVVYLRDSTSFNENLATFISRELTLIYLDEIGAPQEDKSEYHNYLSDSQSLYTFMIAYLDRFDSLYKSIDTFEIVQKERQKQKMFEEFRVDISTLGFNNPFINERLLKNDSMNNAHLLAYRRYGGLQDVLNDQFHSDFDGDIQKMLLYYRNNFEDI